MPLQNPNVAGNKVLNKTLNFHSYGMQNMNGMAPNGAPGPAAGPADAQNRGERMT